MLLGLVVALALSACAVKPEPTTSIALRANATQYFVSEFGVRVGIRLDFPQDRLITGARMMWTGGSDKVKPWPLDGSNPVRPPDTLELPAGEEVLLEGSVVAPCPASPGVPILQVDSEVEGEKRTDRFRPGDSTGFDRAFFDWCRRPVTMVIQGSSWEPGGDSKLHLDISNPGPGTVSVVSRAVTQGDNTWKPMQVDVPPGAIERLTIEGHTPELCAATPPWETGDLLANGTPIEPGGDGWC